MKELRDKPYCLGPYSYPNNYMEIGNLQRHWELLAPTDTTPSHLGLPERVHQKPINRTFGVDLSETLFNTLPYPKDPSHVPISIEP